MPTTKVKTMVLTICVYITNKVRKIATHVTEIKEQNINKKYHVLLSKQGGINVVLPSLT